MICILIPSYRDFALTKKAVESVENTCSEPFTLLINYSRERVGFPKAVNTLFKSALANEDCSEIVLLSNDVEIETDNWISALRPHMGLAGGLAAIPEGERWVYLNPTDAYPYYEKSAEPYQGKSFYVPYPPFSFVYMKREVLEWVGLLDEKFTPGYYEDYDFGLRAWLKGYPSAIEPKVTYRHQLGCTMGKIPGFYPTEQAEYHFEKWAWLISDKTPQQLMEALKRYVK